MLLGFVVFKQTKFWVKFLEKWCRHLSLEIGSWLHTACLCNSNEENCWKRNLLIFWCAKRHKFVSLPPGYTSAWHKSISFMFPSFIMGTRDILTLSPIWLGLKYSGLVITVTQCFLFCNITGIFLKISPLFYTKYFVK